MLGNTTPPLPLLPLPPSHLLFNAITITITKRLEDRALLQVKDKSKYAIKNPEAHAIKKAARLKKRKAAAEAKAGAGGGGPPPAKKAKKGPSPAAKKGTPATEGPLHPSWVAKKQQAVSISQDKPSGKKVVFGD